MKEDTKQVAQPDMDEISAVSKDELAIGYVEDLIPVQDPLIHKLRDNLKAYQQILNDDQVKSTLQQRYGAVVSCEWSVEPASDDPKDREAADFIRDQLERIKFDDKTRKMLAGVFYGYAVAECIWGYDGKHYVLDDIKVRKRHRFRFDRDGKLWLMKGLSDKVQMPDRKFWTFTTGGDDDDQPYGIGLAHWLYWPTYFKRQGLKAWLIFLDKFGQPTPVGKYDPSQKDQKYKILKTLAALTTESALAFPKGVEIDFLEAARSGTADYDKIYERMEKAISKVVLSQTMTTDDGSSLSQARVHDDVKDDVIKADSDLLCSSLNDGPVKWLTEWNFPGAGIPKVYRRIESEPDLKPQAERDNLILKLGYEPTQEYIDTTYGDGYFVKKQGATENQGKQKKSIPPEKTSFAEGDDGHDHVDTDDAVEQLETMTAGSMDSMINNIRDLVMSGDIKDLKDLSDRLLELYPNLQMDDLALVLGQGFALEELKGMDNAA